MNAWAEKVFFLSEYVSEKMSEHNRFPTELTPQEIEKRGLQSSSISSFSSRSSQKVDSFKRDSWPSRKPNPSATQVLQLYEHPGLQSVKELCYFHNNAFSLSEDVIVCSQSYPLSLYFWSGSWFVFEYCLPEPNKITMRVILWSSF